VKPNLTIEDWARLAAFIDGEGSIVIGRQLRFRGKPSQHTGHHLRVVISNTDPRLMTWLKERFDGYVHTSKKPHGNRRTLLQWQVSAQSAEDILRGCVNFLVLKKEQAELAFAFRTTFRKKNYEAVEPAVLEYRESCMQKLKVLREVPAA